MRRRADCAYLAASYTDHSGAGRAEPTTKGQRVGHTYATCTATTGGSNPALQCTGTFKLPGGTLIGSALIDTTGDAPQRIAILGGTGAYEGARGSILSVSKSQNTSVDTFHLLP
jgi:hypothetical protein